MNHCFEIIKINLCNVLVESSTERFYRKYSRYLTSRQNGNKKRYIAE